MKGTLTADWIAEQLRKHRIQQKELARVLDIAPSGITRLLQGERTLRSDEVPAVLSFFARYVEEVPEHYDPAPPKARPRETQRGASAVAEPIGNSMVPVFMNLARRSQVAPIAEYREPPASLRNARDVYAFFVADDELAPLLLTGDVVYVHPGRPPRDGNRVLVETAEGKHEAGIYRIAGGTRRVETGGASHSIAAGDHVRVIGAIEAS